MSEVEMIRVIDPSSKKNIFDTDIKYEIPLYQRGYAWGDKQLVQLVEDICDINENNVYYIGTLIVSNQAGVYEVVDGQQRLTSLFLLLHCLGERVENTLRFACRDKSNYTLENAEKLVKNCNYNRQDKGSPIKIDQESASVDMDQVSQDVYNGIKILAEEVKKKGIEKIRRNLERVILYQIEVPKNTDLNRYFEIMNTRGEQLEQSDIVKANLMSCLSEDTDRYCFAKIWDACSDMNGYVQMHFTSYGNSVRNALFGPYWNWMPSKNWEDIKRIFELDFVATNKTKNDSCILDIINNKENLATKVDEGYLETGDMVRFESIIDFPFFLLHSLKVFVQIHEIRHEIPEKKLMDELLDDKKLIEQFNSVLKYGQTVKDDKAEFAKKFIVFLLQTRFLFDQYIIKREYVNDKSDGEWSLRSIHTSGQKSGKKAYYSNTIFKKEYEHEKSHVHRSKQNLMVQAALRVSYTSPRVMHWITELLRWLSENDYVHYKHNISEFSERAENIAKEAVKKDFFAKCTDGKYEMGVDTPHIVFNYLDFLLWQEHQDVDFVFEFRNSVEHWYPRNPSEGMFDRWENGVDRFGNLCIIQRKVNAKFSNLSPHSKKESYPNDVQNGSLKLRRMSELTNDFNGEPASRYWRETACEEHEKEMLDILKRACQIN